MADKKYQKRYKCPYCEYTGYREDLVSHIDEEHQDMIPEGYTPSRVVFNLVNKKDHGTCVVCKAETEWNETACKYDRLCKKKSCREALRKQATENMVKVYGKPTLLDDAEHQEKMLANRSISGKYKFRDGGVRTYTGSYEKKTLEFFDKVLEVHSDDIMTPGPVFEYKYKGETLKWITDIYYIPANLVIEVKDGGSNPNNREMKSYREKQIAKETMITSLGEVNYLRLTDNHFEQLLEVMAELKMQMIDDSKPKGIISRINEEVGGMPTANSATSAYVVQYGYMNNVFTDEPEGLALANDVISDKILIIDDENHIKSESIDFLNGRKVTCYKCNKPMKECMQIIADNLDKEVDSKFFYEAFTGKEMLTKDQIKFDPMFKEFSLDNIITKASVEVNSVYHQYKKINESTNYLPVISEEAIKHKYNLLGNHSAITIMQDVNGYFMINEDNDKRTKSYKKITDLKKEFIDALK